MPAFSFEKISPPPASEPSRPKVEPKPPRGVLVRIIDRLVQARAKGATPRADAHRRFPTKPAK